MWPFKKSQKSLPSNAETPNNSGEDVVRLFQEQARSKGLEPLPDDAEIIIMPGAMTGEEAKLWEEAMRRKMGLPAPRKRSEE